MAHITLKKRGVWVTIPAPKPKDYSNHLPSKCRHLYNVGKSREWQDCMGVGPK